MSVITCRKPVTQDGVCGPKHSCLGIIMYRSENAPCKTAVQVSSAPVAGWFLCFYEIRGASALLVAPSREDVN